jgi:hypothetical protein
VSQTVDPTFQHVLATYASETNKTVSVWRAVPNAFLDFKPHERTNSLRTILVHQVLSERRFFAPFVGTQEPPVQGLLNRCFLEQNALERLGVHGLDQVSVKPDFPAAPLVILRTVPRHRNQACLGGGRVLA